MRLFGEGEYNLNNLKAIKAKQSFLSLDQDLRECQVDESFLNCTTRHTTDSLLKSCGCLPFNIRMSPEVPYVDLYQSITYYDDVWWWYIAIYSRYVFVPLDLNLNVPRN